MTENTDGLAARLAKAQAEMHNPGFDTTNPHFRSKFASLAAVRNAVVPLLAKHGIAVCQNLTTTERGVACETVLAHGFERMTFGPLVIPAPKNDAHGLGAAATYARRYSLQSVCCVVGDDDDDGNAAVQPFAKLDPLDRENLSVSADHETYAQAFRRAVADGNDLLIVQIRDDCNAEGEEFFRSVWSLLDSKTRAAVKKTLERIKSA